MLEKLVLNIRNELVLNIRNEFYALLNKQLNNKARRFFAFTFQEYKSPETRNFRIVQNTKVQK